MKRLLIILLLFPAIIQAQTTYPIRGISRVVYGGDTLDTKFLTDSTKFVTNNKAFVFNKIVKVNKDTLATNAYARSVGGSGGGITSDSLNFGNDLLSWDRSNRTYKPYASKPTGLGFYTGTTNPDGTTRLNFNGYLYANLISAPTFLAYPSTGSAGYYAAASGTNSAAFVGQAASDAVAAKLRTALSVSANVTGTLFELERIPNAGSYNLTGNFISITDNPTTSGTISGKILTATIGATERISMNPRVADGSSAVAYIEDTHNNLTTPGAKLKSYRNQGVEKFSVDKDGFISRPWGADVASASTITPTGPMFKVTGTTTINTINLPYTGFADEIKIVFKGSLTLGTSGNIAATTITPVIDRLYILIYNPTDSKWYVSN